MMAILTPIAGLDDLHDLIAQLPAADDAVRAVHRAREGVLTKPPGALGKLEAISEQVAVWQAQHPPNLDEVTILIFAGNHGVTKHGISAFPSDVTAQMVANFDAGGAAINQLAKSCNAELQVTALQLDKPTADFTQQPAMSEAACVDAINAGIKAAHESIDLLAIGEMGIGNTTSAAAIAAALFAGDGARWAGPGTGLDPEGVGHKAAVIDQALAKHRAALTDPLKILQYLGGYEIAAMLGAILAGRMRRTPVLIDGFVATAAAAVLYRLDPHALDHCWASHRSAEPAHTAMLEKLGLEPLLDFNMRLGEGSGAALAIPIIRAAVACHNGMASFADAGVSNKGE